jgi:hypothetical protein
MTQYQIDKTNIYTIYFGQTKRYLNPDINRDINWTIRDNFYHVGVNLCLVLFKLKVNESFIFNNRPILILFY